MERRYDQAWRGRIAAGHPDQAWFPAEVPGNIQYDFGKAHDFGDPNEGFNVRKYLPLEDCTWEYETLLNYEQQEGETVWLISRGIDYRYEIFLNGESLYAYEGMFRPVELELTGKLLKDANRLTVRIYPHPKRSDAEPGSRDEADHSCKPPVCYSWDWNPRLLTSGIWDETYLETRTQDTIRDAEAFCTLNSDYTAAKVHFQVDCDAPVSVMLQDARGQVVYQGTDLDFTVENPHLWWCNGQGEPYLYRWTVCSASSKKTGTLAFREVHLVRNEGAGDPPVFPKSRYAAPVTVLLNGRKVFGKGSNWVNPELFVGRVTAERYEELLTLAKDAHMNMLRIWGGSGINKEAFYDCCDRMGIMVWQEFMLACNLYPNEPHYLQVLESEARAIIRRLRRHPSLILWCGGNELFNSWSGMDDQSLPLRLLDKLCYELDPGKPFIKTSPLTGMGHGCYMFEAANRGMDGDVFHSIRHSHMVAYTEFGVPGTTDVETLKRILPEEQQFPVVLNDAWEFRHGLAAWGEEAWVSMPVLEKYFGTMQNLDQVAQYSNILQTAGYQAAFEEMRRQWPHCSLALNWCFNEPWSNAANNCLIDYPARKKPCYEAVKNALRPTLFTAGMDHYAWKEGESFDADLWMLNDSTDTVSGTVTAYLKVGDSEQKLISWTVEELGPNQNVQGPTVHKILPESDEEFFTLRLEAENGFANEYRLRLFHKPRPKAVRQMNADND